MKALQKENGLATELQHNYCHIFYWYAWDQSQIYFLWDWTKKKYKTIKYHTLKNVIRLITQTLLPTELYNVMLLKRTHNKYLSLHKEASINLK